jgi:hypothetical protein
MSDAAIREADARSIAFRVLVDRSKYLRALILGCAAVVPLVVVLAATGSSLLAGLAYALAAGGGDAALVVARRRNWPAESMLMWLGQVGAEFEAARAARLAAPDTATPEERQFDETRAAALEPWKTGGDPDTAALHEAALKLPDEEMRSYEIALTGIRLAVIADRRGQDFMPYLVQAASDVSEVRLRPRAQIELWYLRWRNVIGLSLIGLLIALFGAMAGHA